MTCGGCLSKVQAALSKQDNLNIVSISLASGEIILESSSEPSLSELQRSIAEKGNYSIEPKNKEEVSNQSEMSEEGKNVPLGVYKPLFLIITFILGVSILVQYPLVEFQGDVFMRNFMAGFFIVFSFFKLLNLSGFADSYMMYDMLASKWKTWGYVYPFVELSLGILFLINQWVVTASWLTIIVLGFGLIGVTRSVLSKKKIQCACLGDVFDLPMSSVTIVENTSMIIMSILMLL